MSSELSCPDCGQRLRIPDSSAGQVRCPQCRAIFTAAGAPASSGSDKWSVRTDDGREYGPVDKRELDEWFTEGRLNRLCEVREAGGQDWRPAARLYPNLTDQGSAAASSVAPSARGGAANGDPFARRRNEPYSHRSRLAAGLLGICLGQFGVHRFYLGFVWIGLLQLVLTLATCGMTWVWGMIEGVLILAGAFDRDADGRLLRD